MDVAKGLREELVKSLQLALKLLFSSRRDGKDPMQLAAELVPDRPTVSVAGISASHALPVVKLRYPHVDLALVEEQYAADCSEEDMDRLLGEVAPLADALVKDLELIFVELEVVHRVWKPSSD
uniref:Uncharacterized protein n=1 Tax=Oryza punctata TaxID=4537 RepID=A0A0E0MMP7_ORYPU